MDQTEIPELDWVHVPESCVVESLWDCLHDGELLSCRSDLLNRSVQLEFNVDHLHERSEDVKFLLHFDRVTSVRVNTFVRWPGEFEVPQGSSREEESRLIADYQAKWREQSLGWDEFESSLTTDPLSVTNANLVRNDRSVAFQLNGHLDGDKFDDQYTTLFIHGGEISASRSDGQPFSLQQLIDLGHDYWAAFASRRRKNT